MNQRTESLLKSGGLPASLDAERFVLGSALLGHPFENIAVTVAADDFSLEKHRRIFARMQDLDARGDKIDRLTVANELMRQEQLESVDGLTYLVSLDEGLPSLGNIDAYVNIVRDKSTLRKAIRAHEQAIEDCMRACDPTPEILERSERAIAELSSATRAVSLQTPTEVINRAGGISELLNPKRGGIGTPWAQLNRMLVGRGFMPGQMIVVGARPSMGKTALGCQIADFAATNGTGVAFFTLEMSGESILMRMAAARAQVDGLKVTQGYANQLEEDVLREAFADLADEQRCPLWIDDTTGCTVPAMRAALRKLNARHPIGLVVIDYLQLLECSGGSERRRYEQVSDISRGIKRLAREFKVPVVVLAQLNREMEKDARKPRPSDLRDSGSIEQDADVILMPAREEGQNEHPDVLFIDLIIAKQRNGPLGKVSLKFLRRYAKFVDAAAATAAA